MAKPNVVINLDSNEYTEVKGKCEDFMASISEFLKGPEGLDLESDLSNELMAFLPEILEAVVNLEIKDNL